MAASDPHPRSDRLSSREPECLTPAALRERLEEEISRAERHGTRLSCLLVVIENLEEMAREHGSELREQTIDYVAGALRRELRRFDRVGRVGNGHVEHGSDLDLLIILPGPTVRGGRSWLAVRWSECARSRSKREARASRWRSRWAWRRGVRT